MTADIFNIEDYRDKCTIIYATMDEKTGEAVLEIEGNWEAARELVRHLWLVCRRKDNDN